MRQTDGRISTLEIVICFNSLFYLPGCWLFFGADFVVARSTDSSCDKSAVSSWDRSADSSWLIFVEVVLAVETCIIDTFDTGME